MCLMHRPLLCGSPDVKGRGSNREQELMEVVEGERVG